ncbi:MAG: hypothetical protein ACYDEV_05335 [Acidiferrobacter sp.]
MKTIADLDARRLSWRERRIRAWVRALPTAEPVRAVGLLVQSVRALNSSVLDPATRVALLACYEEPTMNLAIALLKPQAESAGAALVTVLHSEIAHGYQMALSPELRLDLRQQAVLGALSQLGGVVRAAYRAYLPTPPGLWRRVHTLFRAAGSATESIERSYVAILLLGLADPYGLPAGGIDVVWRIIREIGHYAVLNDAIGFAVAADADRAAEPAGTEGAIFLDTGSLVAEITRLHARLRADKSLPTYLAAFVLPSLADRLFASLSETWRPGPRRRSPRVRLSGERLVCHGLAALQQLASGDTAHERYVDLDGVWESGSACPVTSEVSASLPPITTWKIRDAGRSGLWLSSQNLVDPPPAPGTWIGIKDPERDGQWRVAVVRWLKRSRPREYAMGVEVLDEAQTSTILRASPKATSFMAAVGGETRLSGQGARPAYPFVTRTMMGPARPRTQVPRGRI